MTKKEEKELNKQMLINFDTLKSKILDLGCICSKTHTTGGQNPACFFKLSLCKTELHERFRIEYFRETKFFTLGMLRKWHEKGKYEDIIEPQENFNLIFNIIKAFTDCYDR
jgi:hypothetical protein